MLGLGLTGYTLARHLAARGANVRVADTRPAPPFAAKLAAALPDVPLVTGPFTAATFAGADLDRDQPGRGQGSAGDRRRRRERARSSSATSSSSRARCRPSRRCSRSPARTASRPSPRSPARCAARAGLATVVAGNIGDAVLDALAAPDANWPDVFVLELSSFQLETTSSLAPTAATVLNVTDNHLDRYAGIDDYAAAKARIFAAAASRC